MIRIDPPRVGDRLVGRNGPLRWRGEVIAVVPGAVRNSGAPDSVGALVRFWDGGGRVWLGAVEWSPWGLSWGMPPGGVAYRDGEEPDSVRQGMFPAP